MSRSNPDVGTAISQSLLPGAVGGLGAYLLSYVALFLLLLIEGGNILQNQAWRVAGWVFYGAHNVNVTISGLGMSESQNVLQTLSDVTSIPVIVYYLVPVVVLVVVGYIVASRVPTGGNVLAGAAAGATAILGYLILAVAGTFVFAIGSQGASAGPDLLTSALIAGLAYPLVFGAVGGAIAGATN